MTGCANQGRDQYLHYEPGSLKMLTSAMVYCEDTSRP